jgi:urease accessory protein
LLRLIEAWNAVDLAAVVRWNEVFVASRETAELRAETLQMGYSLRKLAVELRLENAQAMDVIDDISYPAAFAFAAAASRIDAREALAAYLFAWIENQVLAALKAIPLGQTEGQRVLRDLAAAIPALVERAASLADDELANFAPGLALASSRHETQYSRIFRS